MSSSNIAPAKKQTFSVAISTESYQNLIRNTLKDPKRANRFIASITSAVATTPALQTCEPSSILAGGLLGEALNLSPSPQLGQYYLVPFKQKAKYDREGHLLSPECSKAQFVLGYKGYVQLALRSGQYSDLDCMEIRQGEYLGKDPHTAKPQFKFIEDDDLRESLPIVGYMAYFEYLNGFRKCIYWSREKMLNHADTYSQAFSKDAYDKIQNGQISSVALMDARSIAATAANKGFLTAADEFTGTYTKPAYHFDKKIYENRVFDSKGVADPSVEIQFGPNIKDWPAMPQLAENLILKVVSEIHDPVTTTDELIPSGETSSFRSNPLGLAEFTLSRKDPAYVGRAKEVQVAEKAIQEGNCPAEALPELKPVFAAIHTQYPDIDKTNVGVGSTIFAVKPGDGSAREQAASCQRVLGGNCNIAREYATKRYRSNLINWGMLPFLYDGDGESSFALGDLLYVPSIREVVSSGAAEFDAYVISADGAYKKITLGLAPLTDDEKKIILCGCLINFYRAGL